MLSSEQRCTFQFIKREKSTECAHTNKRIKKWKLFFLWTIVPFWKDSYTYRTLSVRRGFLCRQLLSIWPTRHIKHKKKHNANGNRDVCSSSHCALSRQDESEIEMDRLFWDWGYVPFDALLGNPLTVFGQIAYLSQHVLHATESILWQC